MADLFLTLVELLAEGVLTRTGRFVLSLGGWKSGVFGETWLGLWVWMLVICLAIALFAWLV